MGLHDLFNSHMQQPHASCGVGHHGPSSPARPSHLPGHLSHLPDHVVRSRVLEAAPCLELVDWRKELMGEDNVDRAADLVAVQLPLVILQ